MTADIDMYVGAIKHFDGVPYYYAVPAEKVKTFKAPTPPAVVSPEALWVTCYTRNATCDFLQLLSDF